MCARRRVQGSADPSQANALSPNWGNYIFQSANEVAANIILRKRLDEIQAQTEAEKQWWDRRRAVIQEDFMKELDGPGKAGKAGSEEDAVLVEVNTPASTPSAGGKKKKGKK